MKKLNLKAFTLVEMLIVIVIIGILISALLPRMQAAQGKARDVVRQTGISQIGSAVIVAQSERGRRPGAGSNTYFSDCINVTKCRRNVTSSN
jgi:prepilin-type N-terminal cleavage/methylation domain-containing protein